MNILVTCRDTLGIVHKKSIHLGRHTATQLETGTKVIEIIHYQTVRNGLEEVEIFMFLFQFIMNMNHRLWLAQHDGLMGDGRLLKDIDYTMKAQMKTELEISNWQHKTTENNTKTNLVPCRKLMNLSFQKSHIKPRQLGKERTSQKTDEVNEFAKFFASSKNYKDINK